MEVQEAFKQFDFTNYKDAVKVTLALFIETAMVGKDKKIQFDLDMFGKVDDQKVLKNYDWSIFFYNHLF